MGAEEPSGLVVDIVRAIATAEGKPVNDLDFVLNDYVDTAALELLNRGSRGTWEITFRVPDHEVSVGSDGQILVDGEPSKVHEGD